MRRHEGSSLNNKYLFDLKVLIPETAEENTRYTSLLLHYQQRQLQTVGKQVYLDWGCDVSPDQPELSSHNRRIAEGAGRGFA